ncbi:MAG TPA: UvrB/UvrC motif-containing protein, partial [Reyranella sp.]|nr:UvrB/UvrC motif-containing protein [Reyranella sp.]
AEERQQLLDRLDADMRRAADDLDFELAAQLRDQILDLKANGGGRGPGAGGQKDGAPKRRRRARR